MPVPPPPPPGPPPPPTFSQANTVPPKISRDEAKGRGALLSDICKGARLKKVAAVNDRSAPIIEKPGGRGGASGGIGASGGGGGSGPKPMGGLFSAGVPKLRPVGDGTVGRSALQPPGSRPALPRVASHSELDGSARSGEGDRTSAPEQSRNNRPLPPDAPKPSHVNTKPSSSAPPPPPPFNRGGNRGPSSNQQSSGSSSQSREKHFPPPHASKGPPLQPSSARDGPPRHNPGSSRTSSSTVSSSAPPPPPPYRQSPNVSNGELAPELPQRRNSLNKKSHPNAHVRGQAPPPPPPSSQQNRRPPPPTREPLMRSTAPQAPPPVSRNGVRDTPPPPPPYRLQTEAPSRGKPPPLSSAGRQPSGHAPPPPPPIRNGHTSHHSRSPSDDFESKYSFHPIQDLPPPEEYRSFQKIYPSKTNKGTVRGAPPLPPPVR
ncbi:WAS/WASL-interacting protein family member 2 [Misgurnus anguillicaudatus]|uniref:WAS/WASL-interacting protein family member 2 n=1 Tax=Misgurnus anguillicaudatus TaxID=75329 RepID=UPI003CCF07D0